MRPNLIVLLYTCHSFGTIDCTLVRRENQRGLLTRLKAFRQLRDSVHCTFTVRPAVQPYLYLANLMQASSAQPDHCQSITYPPTRLARRSARRGGYLLLRSYRCLNPLRAASLAVQTDLLRLTR